MKNAEIGKRLRDLAKVAGEGIRMTKAWSTSMKSLRSLEKGLLDLADKIDQVETLYAVAFGEDWCDGDSAFYAPGDIKLSIIDADLLSTGGDQSLIYEELLKKWIKSADAAPDDEQPIGFWIVNEATREAANVIWNSEPGNDGATYACNRAAKEICNGQQVNVVARPGWTITDGSISFDPKKAKSGE